jgi:hypothetical protein
MTPELRASCELVFQEHKLAASPIAWNKHIFREKMSIGLSDLAKETLVKKKIIYFPKPAKKTITILNPEVATASSFEEAIAIAESKSSAIEGEPVKEKTLYDEIYSPEFLEYADPEDFTPPRKTIKEQTKPKVKEIQTQADIQLQTQSALVAATATEEKWWLKPAFYYVIWPLAAAIVSVTIAWLMSQAVEMAYR